MRHSMTHPETFLKGGRMYVRAGVDSSTEEMTFCVFFARDGETTSCRFGCIFKKSASGPDLKPEVIPLPLR